MCIRAPLLYTKGLVVLWDHTNHIYVVAATIYKGNEAHDSFARSSIVKMAGSSAGEAILKIHLCVEKAQGLYTELADQELALMRVSL